MMLIGLDKSGQKSDIYHIFTRLDGQPDEIQQHTSEELARECFRLFDEPDSAEMYSKIELSCHDWETGMDEILETMTF